MNPRHRIVQWAGGGVFVGALAFLFYSYAAVWGRIGPFAPAAVAVDGALFTLFAAHHSVFARDPVKRWLGRVVPEPLMRSVYVWIASLLLILMCAAWRPIGGELYRIEGWPAAVFAAVQLAGMAVIARAVRAIDGLELAGIRPHVATDVLQIGGPYRWVRHPLYLGWFFATFGAAHMTGDRAIFAGIAALYLVIAVPFEERALERVFGAAYDRYCQQVRWRILPYVY